MKTLKALREEMRAFNLDDDTELDLDALGDIDLDALLGAEFGQEEETEYTPLDFSDLGSMPIDDFVDDDSGEFNLDAENADGDDVAGFSNAVEDFDDATASEDIGNQSIDSVELSDDDGLSADDVTGSDTPEDTNFQGEIRTVRGANLVYKRKMDDGNFEELWIYNVGNDIKRETQIRRAILAGTDVDPGAQESKDGSQRAETTTTGNVQFLSITGLPQ
ncbi:hypothetical protein Xoosp13_215 [Xanthomonas phage Xoo-sp13]|nr:hypothetical protein Xoosp13_215 [Xanthomonas phage Xoo-sp13]